MVEVAEEEVEQEVEVVEESLLPHNLHNQHPSSTNQSEEPRSRNSMETEVTPKDSYTSLDSGSS